MLSIFASLLGERLLFKSASIGERESYFVIIHSPFCFPPGVERVFIWIIFVAAISSTIVIEESASGVSQPFHLLCVEILNLPFFAINILDFELDPASVSCVRGRESTHWPVRTQQGPNH